MSAVDSVMQLERAENEISVVVVDNASPGGTGAIVQERMASYQNVYFLSSDENVGFARGNNIGFAFAKNELKADFIVLMNNDAVVETKNFCKLVLHDFESEKFAVLGPDIRTPNGRHQNPLRMKMLKGLRLKMTIAYLWLDLILTLLWLSPLVAKLLQNRNSLKGETSQNAMNDVELHGSFLIFSPLYIQKFDGLDDRTFMYCEEEFLFARCVANGMKSRYNPEIKVNHNEIENSKGSIIQLRKKSLFRIRNCIKSLKLYSKIEMKSF